MTSLRHYFNALLTKIEPSDERKALCSTLPGNVRDWLQDHDFETASPHSRLSGSYRRQTATLDVNDVDVLLFLPELELETAPSAVISRVKKILEDYPDTSIDTKVQRRSVRLDFPNHGLHLDIVPAVAKDGLDKPLKVPDKPQGEWVDSDPLGYKHALSELNKSHNTNVVSLIKVIKGWRDEQMKIRRPKSYVLEAIIFNAVNEKQLTVTNLGWGEILAATFSYIWNRWEKLFESGEGIPRVKDPQLGHMITMGWERSHFETFMRRIRDSRKASSKALDAMGLHDEEQATEEWKRVFGGLWPSKEEALEAARAEASTIQPGSAKVGSSGSVVGISSGVTAPSTRYYGES